MTMDYGTGAQHVLSIFIDDVNQLSTLQMVVANVALSVMLLSFILHLWLRRPWTLLSGPDSASIASASRIGRVQGYITKIGGIEILAFKATRFGALAALLFLSLISSLEVGWDGLAKIFTGYLIAAVVLASLDLIVSARTSRIVAPYLGLVTFAIFAFYAYRDIWPLMTFTLRPVDAKDRLLWIKVGLATWAGLLEPLLEPYPFVPVHSEDRTVIANPEQTASIMSRIIFTFLDPIIWRAYSLPHLAHDQLPPLADYDEAHYLIEQHYKTLDPLSGARKGNMLWAILKVLRIPLTIQTMLLVLSALLKLAGPVGMNRLLNYLEHHGEDAFIKPWVWILLVTFGPVAATLSGELFLFFSTRSLIRVEGLLTALIFDHALRLRVKVESSDNTNAGSSGTSKSGADGNFVGKIMNMVTSDLANVTGGRNFQSLILGVPIQVALSMWFLYSILGWSSLVGLAVMIVLLPVPRRVAGLLSSVQKEKMKATDGRVQVVSEIMNVLRMIKLFGWEKRAQDDIAVKREEELKWVWKKALYGLINDNVNYIIPLLHMVATYATYTLVMKQNLTASIVFSSLSAFTTIRSQLNWSSNHLPVVIASYVSMGRLSDFLWKTELLDSFNEKTAGDAVVTPASHFDDIGFGKAEFTWTGRDATRNLTEQSFRLRITDDVVFHKGSLNLIYGPTACGKTSILMALLGEMHYVPLGPESWVNLPRERGVAYAAQESWVLSDTVKQNILFGSSFDEERYKKVIYQCALTEDLRMFDAGDNTQIGEKGITLSGGQKARVTLARAVYSSADTLLLDDILAALDVHTAQWITSRCLGGDLLKGRTVILVTHRVAFVSPLAKYVISMGHGEIQVHGTAYEIFKVTPEDAERMVASQLEALDQTAASADPDATLVEPTELKEGKLVIAEEIALGHVSKNAYMLFLGNLATKGVLALAFWCQYLGGAGLSEVCVTLELWWLGYWANQYRLHDHSGVHVTFYLGIYALIILASVAVHIYRTIIYTYGSLRAARTVHNKLMSSVIGSTFRWLDVTPTSRVITRCTQDIQAADGPVAQSFKVLVEVAINMVTRLGAVVVYTPIFLPPAILIVAPGIWLGTVYIKAQLSVKREMSNCKAPVLAMFGGAVHGLVSIRAYGAQDSFREELLKKINDYTRAGRVFWALNRWVATRLNGLSAIFAGSIAVYFVYGNTSINPSGVGFVLTMAVSFTTQVMNFIHWLNNFEVNANSLERLQQYIAIEQEPKDGNKPPAHWPSSGNLHVKGLSASYTEAGPKVLRELTFDVKSGERVGVVGRTGAGKSTLTLALLRCIPTEGLVMYDNIPTNTLTLDALRSHITIIPQVPELMSGTLRHNLDPFAEYDDATLNDALRSAGLFSLQQQIDENARITLDTKVAGGGANLSVGQRQIVALARAIVRQSKLLILDEATSAIDYETDAVIQQSLRQELKSDVTVITVAHRLQTIMDCDKIMVLDAGRLVEFDTPQALLEKKYGLFRAMVDQSADKDALYAAANGR